MDSKIPFTHSRQAGIVFGFLCLVIGVSLGLFLFWQAGRAMLDPRFLNDSMSRWDALVRTRTLDWSLEGMETPDRRRLAGSSRDRTPDATMRDKDRLHDASRFVNQVGLQAVRPIVILIMIALLALMIRIAVGFMEIGVRLARLSAADSDQAVLTEAVRQLLEDSSRRDR